jgi:DNA-binding NtrC family response regulator
MSQQRKVLVIDDEIDLCNLLKGFLVRKGFDVKIFHTLKEGLDIIKNYYPDILLLDHNLPDAQGWTVAPQLALEYPQMHIILMSAFHSTKPEMPPAARYETIEKPISLKDLEQHLASLN